MNQPLFGALVRYDATPPASASSGAATHRITSPAWARAIALAALALVCLSSQSARAEEPRRALAPLAAERVIDQARFRDPRCRASIGAEAFARTELFFGLSRPGGIVTEEDFKNFVDARVTPRFPDGLTLLSGVGQFRDASGTTIVEGSKLLVLLYPRRDAEANRKIEAIRGDYKVQFQQESVLRTDDLSCVSF